MSIVTNLKCTLAVTAGLCSSFAYAQKHPHVILIMTDQQRGDALGCMGNEAVISPNLDRLAGEGTLFLAPAVLLPVRECSPDFLPGITACWGMEKYLPNINMRCPR